MKERKVTWKQETLGFPHVQDHNSLRICVAPVVLTPGSKSSQGPMVPWVLLNHWDSSDPGILVTLVG